MLPVHSQARLSTGELADLAERLIERRKGVSILDLIREVVDEHFHGRKEERIKKVDAVHSELLGRRLRRFRQKAQDEVDARHARFAEREERISH